MLIFQHLHVACKTPHSSTRQLGNTSENIRWFKCTVHIHICTSDVKCNQLQYLHNWVNSDFVHILLCRLLHQVRGNKAEPSEKVMSIGTWRNTWGICRKRKKMSSHELHKRTERSSTAPQQTKSLLPVNSDVINWQTQGNINHLQIEALVCLLHSFPLDLNNAGVLFTKMSPLGYRDFSTGHVHS